MQLNIHFGAGTRVVSFNGATYDLNKMDRMQFNILRKSIASKFKGRKRQR